MKREYIILPILLSLAAIITYLFFLLWQPFFSPIAWAAIFAILLYPFYDKIYQRIPNKSVSATIMTLLVLLIIVVPLTALGILLVAEIISTYDLIQGWFDTGKYDQVMQFFKGPFIDQLRDQVGGYVNIENIDLYSIVSQAMQRLSTFAVSQLTNIVQNFSKFLFSFVLMVFTLFFFFKDGEKMVEFLKDVIPLEPKRENEIFQQFAEVIVATVVGDLAVALLQGTLGGIAFWILGLPSPVFWGALMAFLSIFPVVGAPIVYLPAAGILFAQNELIRAIILLLWGTLVVSQIDNFLRPILISGRTKLHTLLLFFSILGGIYIFGFLGIIMGPVIAALFYTMLNIFKDEFADDPRLVGVGPGGQAAKPIDEADEES
jgi:predicted PurR-regulated permease PerM